MRGSIAVPWTDFHSLILVLWSAVWQIPVCGLFTREGLDSVVFKALKKPLKVGLTILREWHKRNWCHIHIVSSIPGIAAYTLYSELYCWYFKWYLISCRVDEWHLSHQVNFVCISFEFFLETFMKQAAQFLIFRCFKKVLRINSKFNQTN